MSTEEVQSGIGTTARDPVASGNNTDSDYLQNPLDNARRREVVVWILIALLGAFNIVAFYVMWLKLTVDMN
jgi:hypothetical protein